MAASNLTSNSYGNPGQKSSLPAEAGCINPSDQEEVLFDLLEPRVAKPSPPKAQTSKPKSSKPLPSKATINGNGTCSRCGQLVDCKRADSLYMHERECLGKCRRCGGLDIPCVMGKQSHCKNCKGQKLVCSGRITHVKETRYCSRCEKSVPCGETLHSLLNHERRCKGKCESCSNLGIACITVGAANRCDNCKDQKINCSGAQLTCIWSRGTSKCSVSIAKDNIYATATRLTNSHVKANARSVGNVASLALTLAVPGTASTRTSSSASVAQNISCHAAAALPIRPTRSVPGVGQYPMSAWTRSVATRQAAEASARIAQKGTSLVKQKRVLPVIAVRTVENKICFAVV